MIRLLKETFYGFSNDRCTTLAASLAYYTIFALPPLLFILVMLVTTSIRWYFGDSNAEERAFQVLEQQLSMLVGNQTAQEEIGRIMRNQADQGGQGWKALLSILGIVIGATGVVTSLQSCLNLVWGIKPDPNASFWRELLFKRIISFAMILALGFVLLVSFVITATLKAFTSAIGSRFGIEETTSMVLNHAISAAIITLILAAILRFIPDARIKYRDVWAGAIFTAILFFLGRIALTYYLSLTNPGQELGAAAAALVIILIWVYYNGIILLLGAEFTKAWVIASGRRITPEAGAIKFEETPVEV